jgi:hypothetical protein
MHIGIGQVNQIEFGRIARFTNGTRLSIFFKTASKKRNCHARKAGSVDYRNVPKASDD